MRPFPLEKYDVIINRFPIFGQLPISATFFQDKAQELNLIDAEVSGADKWDINSGNTTADEEGTAIFVGESTAFFTDESKAIFNDVGIAVFTPVKNTSIFQLGSGTTLSIGVSSDIQTSTRENQRFDLDEIRSVFYSIGEDDDFLLQKEHSEIIAKYLDHRPSWIRDLIFDPQSSIESAFRTLVFIGEGLRSRLEKEALDILCLALSHNAPYLRHGSIMAYLAWDNPAITKILSEHRKSENSPALCRLIDRALKRRSA